MKTSAARMGLPILMLYDLRPPISAAEHNLYISIPVPSIGGNTAVAHRISCAGFDM